MSAFGNSSGGDSTGLGSLLGASSTNASSGEQNENSYQAERTT